MLAAQRLAGGRAKDPLGHERSLGDEGRGAVLNDFSLEILLGTEHEKIGRRRVWDEQKNDQHETDDVAHEKRFFLS